MSFLIAWLLNAVYLTLLVVASPWILWSALKHGKYRAGFAEKLLGLVPPRAGQRPCDHARNLPLPPRGGAAATKLLRFITLPDQLSTPLPMRDRRIRRVAGSLEK